MTDGVCNNDYRTQTEQSTEKIIHQLVAGAAPTVSANLKDGVPWRVSHYNQMTDGVCNNNYRTQTEQSIEKITQQLMAGAAPAVSVNQKLEGYAHHFDRRADGVGSCSAQVDIAIDKMTKKLANTASPTVLGNLRREVNHMRRPSQKRNCWELKALDSCSENIYGNLQPYSTNLAFRPILGRVPPRVGVPGVGPDLWGGASPRHVCWGDGRSQHGSIACFVFD